MASQENVKKTMSFEQPKKDAARGAIRMANPLQQNNALNLQSAQMSAKNATIEQQTAAFGGKSSEIVTLELDEAGSKSKGSQKEAQSVISVEVVPDQNVQSYNEISSFPVDTLNCAETVSKLSTILSAYSSEIDFSVNMEKNTIENGCVFINNYYSVYFMIYVETDEANKTTRFEFRRQSSDALASSKCLGDIKSQFFGDNKEETSLVRVGSECQ